MKYQKARIVIARVGLEFTVGTYLWVRAEPPRIFPSVRELWTDLSKVNYSSPSYITDVPTNQGDPPYLIVPSCAVELEPEFKESAS